MMDNLAHPNYSHIDVKHFFGGTWGKINGVNISVLLEADAVSEIRNALLKHLVIFFQNQCICLSNNSILLKILVSLWNTLSQSAQPEGPLVTEVIRLEHETLNFGGVWHSDTAQMQKPSMASMLYAIEITPFSGDTIFSNHYMTCRTLSQGLKKALYELVALNTFSQQ